MNKFLLVGLGNPGEKYQDTRHNIGFKIADALCDQYKSDFNSERYAEIATLKIKGRQVFLLKPTTFMNLSGKAVRYYMLLHNIKIENVLIVSDDLHVPFGKIKFKRKGSHGGHNGHRDIIEKLKTSLYPRMKFGIGSNFKASEQSRYVLGHWLDEEERRLADFIKIAVDAITNFCILGIDKTMSEFN